MTYVDGFLLPLKRDKIKEYRKQAEAAGRLWIEHGALAFRECIAEDMHAEGMRSFPEAAEAKEDETVIFSYIVFSSREHRDSVNTRVMADPRIKEMCNSANELFECKRMAYGGFSVLVDPKENP